MAYTLTRASTMLRTTSYPVEPPSPPPAPFVIMPPKLDSLVCATASMPSLPLTPTSSVDTSHIHSPHGHHVHGGSLTSALVQFVEFGSTVVRQLRRMEVDLEDRHMLSVFQGIRTRLPLMLDLVRKIMLQMDAGLVSEDTQEVMLPVVRSCVRHAEQLSELVNKTLPSGEPATGGRGEGGTWPRGKKAALGVLVEPEVARIDQVLKANFDVLAQAGTFQAANRSSSSTFNMMGGGGAMLQPEMYPATPLGTISEWQRRSATFHGGFGGIERRSTFQPGSSGNRPPPMPNLPAIPVTPATPMGLPRVSTGISLLQHRGSIASVASFNMDRRPSSYNTVFMVPFPRDINFVGRNELLKNIDSKFMEQSCVALTGLGGIGKTQIVIEYAYIFRERNPKAHVFWVYGNSPTRFEECYEEIARRLILPGWDEPTVDNLELVNDWFTNNPSEPDDDEEDDSARWLFILDNADDASTFYPSKQDDGGARNNKSYAKYIPINSTGAVLITTRDRRVGERLSGRTRPLEVSMMTADEATELLMSKVPEENWDEDEGIKLAEELLFLPLAITQAAAFISENNITVSEYLEMLDAGDEDIKELLSEHLEDSRRELDTENSVMRTWKLSFDQISKGMPRAAEILSLLSVMDYHNVHPTLLRKEKETEFGFKTGLGALQAFHLITVGRGKDAVCKMHRLVALSTQKWLELKGQLDHWRARALRVLERKFPGPGKQNYSDWATYESLTPHARLMFTYQFEKADDMLLKAKLLVAVTLYHLSKGRYSEAFDMSSKALEIRQNLLPHDDPDTLDSVQTIGEALLHRGELKMARTMLERAVAGREKSLGPENPDTLESLSDLTITLLELGDNATAETTALKALNGRGRVLGPDHPDTIVSQNIYAVLRHRQGHLAEARELYERVLARREELLGSEHPDTIMTRNNLARLYLDLGEYELAGPLTEAVIAGEERVLGSEGYDIQASMSNLALIRCHYEDYDGAERLIRRVLAMREKLLGREHPSAVWSVEMLADTLRCAGDAEGAERLDKVVLERTKPRVEETGELLRAGLLFD